MNQNGQTTTKRSKNRSSGVSLNASSSISSNVQRTINRSMRNNYPNNPRGMDGNMSSSSSSSSLHRNIHPSKSSQSMMVSQTSGTNHHPHHHHMANAVAVTTEVPCNSGVYKNKRLVHAMTSLIGCLIEVQLDNGIRYEGILKTFSSDFQLALCSAALIDNIDDEKRCQPSANNSSSSNNIGNLLGALECEENVVETLVISPKNLVTFKALNVDLDFATKKAVMTDSEIAKHDGTTKQHRELIPWDGGEDGSDGNDSMGLDTLDDHSGLSLAGNVSNGWKTEDMFKLNESKYNIETTYQDDMSEYTIKLEHRNDEEYKQREAQAAKIAREIEQDSTRLARYAKEDELDEESRYSAVIRGDPDMTESGSNMTSPPNNSYNNNNHHHHYRNDMNHHPSDRNQPDRNRDNNLRISNSGDNLGGFRTQNSRQNRGRLNANRVSGGNSSGGDRSGGGPSTGPNESNWRDANNRVSANHRYHQQQSQQPYGSAQNPNKSNSGYVDRKYNAINSQQQSPNQQQQQPQQTYQSSAASQANNNKSSYSSVSARNVPNDMMATTNEMETIKTFTRSSGQHGQPPPSNDSDNVGYQRKTSSGNNSNSLPQRESFKQQQQRTPYNRVVEQQQSHHQQHQHHTVQQSHSESKMPSNNNKSLESSDISSTKSSLPTSPSSGPSSNISTPTAELSLMKPQTTNVASKTVEIHQSKSNDQNYQPQTRITSPKQRLDGNNNNRKSLDPLPTGENRPTMVDAIKKGTNMNQQQQQQQPGKSLISIATSKLNPNAKVFTPRAVQLPTATPPQQPNPQQVVAPLPPPNYASPYPSVAAGHMSATTPPSIPSTPSLAGPAGTVVPAGQFIPYTHPHPGGGGAPGPHLTGHAAHHAPQQPIRYPIQFQYNPMMTHQMVPQYIAIQHFATSMPAGAVTATAPPTAVVTSQQSSGVPQNQPLPPSGSSHHMIAANAQSMATQAAGANSLVQNNGHGPQPQQGVLLNNHNNRSINHKHADIIGAVVKGGPGGNPNANQQSQQQQLIRHQHHEAFVSQQQAQVANVTGQPIMTGATQPQHLPVVFPAQTVHHHHHAQNQIHHGQPGGQSAAMAAQLAASAQPGHQNQALTHYMYQAGFPRPLLPTHQSHHHHPNALNMAIQPGLYAPPDAHMPTVYMQTEMPPTHQIVTAQSMAPPPNANIPQTIVIPTSGGNGPAATGTAAVVSATPSSAPQGSVPTSQQSQQQQPTFG
ncbi:hypothetical protein HUG17_2029 [Dermatophagoides farinae]|uniref:LsmAD domain-containing protein n=1 Tax=Dermatophagoides farinae TaxID=6954 RepID=A0A9D4SM21_DERFA|nr:hypothetical protein HUG17_2029 [Dermatophagoides farinae]